MRTLGIDTSNYATSLAVFDTNAGEVVCDCKRFLPVRRVNWACARAMRCSTIPPPCRKCWQNWAKR